VRSLSKPVTIQLPIVVTRRVLEVEERSTGPVRHDSGQAATAEGRALGVRTGTVVPGDSLRTPSQRAGSALQSVAETQARPAGGVVDSAAPAPETVTELALDTQDRGGMSESGVKWALSVAIWPWVISRLLVGGALAIANQVLSGTHQSSAVAARVHQGLLGWDAGWYESIAKHGYWGSGHDSLRFFPLVPLLSKAISFFPGLGVGSSLLVMANASALFGIAWAAALARRETSDPSFARRVAWIVSLAPPAFTFVMGYAEATLLLLSVGTFWALRGRRWWLAAGLGFLAALCRPFGVLLLVPALVEGLRGWHEASRGDLAKRACAVVSPALGLGAFLGWVGWRYGDALAPLRIQEEGVHRGALADPIPTLAHDASLLVHGHHLGSALHLPWVLLALLLLAIAFWRLPLSYGLFAAAIVGVSLTTANLDGFERYALSAFPLVFAAAALPGSDRVERFVLVIAGAGMVGYALLAFMNLYVP
jgi:hypothetical protein